MANGAQGPKIFKNLGMYVTNETADRVPTDDLRFDPIWAKAGALDIPVLIHTGDPRFSQPHDHFRHAFWKLFGLDLPDAVLRKLYYGNALRIIPGMDPDVFQER